MCFDFKKCNITFIIVKYIDHKPITPTVDDNPVGSKYSYDDIFSALKLSYKCE